MILGVMKFRKLLLIAGIVILIWCLFLFNKNKYDNIGYVKVVWNSMEPTLKDGEIIKVVSVDDVNKLDNKDIVIFRLYNSKNYFIKRLWIKPGDKFRFFILSWNILKVFVNNKYTLYFKNYENKSFYKMLKIWAKSNNQGTVKTSQCFVLWDNFKSSSDSFDFWFISCKRIMFKTIENYVFDDEVFVLK